MARTMAVLTTHDSGGPSELVRDGTSGLVTEPTPEAVAAGLDGIARDRAGAERMGRAALAASAMSLGYSIFATRVAWAALWPGFVRVARWFLMTTFFNVAAGAAVFILRLWFATQDSLYLAFGCVFGALAGSLGVVTVRLFWSARPRVASIEPGRS